ncbi:hypothetical protein EPN42_12305 [bacterium]|nr:MAG: hypothetical protein EPN42_12305 [bacterium]
MDVQALLAAAVVARAPDPAFAQGLTTLLPVPGLGIAPPANGQLQLPAAFAQIFTGVAQAMNVSFQIVHHPDEIVYTFFDPATGQELFSVPPPIIQQLAEMFDSPQGVVLDGHA